MFPFLKTTKDIIKARDKQRHKKHYTIPITLLSILGNSVRTVRCSNSRIEGSTGRIITAKAILFSPDKMPFDNHCNSLLPR